MITENGKVYNVKSKKFLNPSKNKGGYLIIDLQVLLPLDCIVS